jgi:hypothetical protein
MSRILLPALLLSAVALGACTRADGTHDARATNAIVGATGGAMIGQAIGRDSRSTLIGAAGGAAVGAALGADAEAQQRQAQGGRRIIQY